MQDMGQNVPGKGKNNYKGSGIQPYLASYRKSRKTNVAEAQ